MNGLLDAGLAPFVALDDGGGEPHPLELGHLERDLARRRGESALVVPGVVCRALIGALVGPGADELVGLLVEHGNRLGYGLPPGMIEFGD